MAGTYLGLDIGSKYIKAVEARGGGGRVEVTGIAIAPTPPDTFDGGAILDAQRLGQAIRQMLRDAGIGTKQVVSAAASNISVVVRVVEVPAVSDDKELATQMQWEIERQIPFAATQTIMDYARIERPEGTDPSQQNIEVLLAVAQQDFIDQHVEVLFAAGLNPKAIDVVPLAVGRALLDIGEPAQAAGHTALIANIGAGTTDIGVFRDNLPAFLRTLPVGGDNFTRAIAEALQVDMDTAERYKRDLAEVMFEQLPQAGFGVSGALPGESGGFIDFTEPPPMSASGPISSPSGRMPFDFSGAATESTEFSSPSGGLAPSSEELGGGSGGLAPSSGELGESSGGLAGPSQELNPPSTPFDFSAQQAEGETPGVIPPLAADVPPAFGEATPHPQPQDALKIQIFNAIAPHVTDLVQELRRSLDFYRSRSGDAPVHEILLCGGMARLPKLAEFIEHELGISTRVVNPLRHVQMSIKKQSYDMDEVGPLFAVSLGLAAYDLLPEPAKRGRKK